MYQRVIPRDLFNEAKLLKCFGQLSLHLHDRPRDGVSLEHDGEAFEVMLTASGFLTLVNVRLSAAGNEVELFTAYNSRAPWPLQYEADNGDNGFVFDDAGQFSEDFEEVLQRQRAPDNSDDDQAEEGEDFIPTLPPAGAC